MVRSLPPLWQEAFRRDAAGEKTALPDPQPERRLARLLAGFISAGLVFMLLPGTVLGVWNLIGISSRRAAEAIPTAWIQAHGHAQLLGWVGTFIIGISLYTLPKFRGALPRSVPVGWAMLAMWTAAVTIRWLAGVEGTGWRTAFPVSAALEWAVALLLVWQCSRTGPSHRSGQAWEILIFSGFAGLLLTLSWQLVLLARPPAPAIPATEDRLLINLALWVFCLPVVTGYAGRLFPGLLFTPKPSVPAAWATAAGVAVTAACYMAGRPFVGAAATMVAILTGCWTIRVFHPALRAPKLTGIDPRYPQFARAAFAWLVIAGVLGLFTSAAGVLGASRHAFTVGFLATLIFAIGPRILPSFLNSRELWSPGLMRISLVLLTLGCLLRVGSEPLAYMNLSGVAWRVLPVSAMLELSAVIVFAVNMAKSLATPVPAWFGRQHVKQDMTVYWLISSYPATRGLLIDGGLATLDGARAIPRSLTLGDAAAADQADLNRLIERLGDFFEARLANSVRRRKT